MCGNSPLGKWFFLHFAFEEKVKGVLLPGSVHLSFELEMIHEPECYGHACSNLRGFELWRG